jgi:hypothetical protein
MTDTCNAVPRADRRLLGRVVAMLAVAAMGLVLQGCNAASGGPTIGFRNETDTVIKATFWVGERDATRVGGAKMRRADEMNVAPNMRTRDSLTPLLQYRSGADTVVRLQIRPAVTSFTGPREYWYEFASPSPYIVRATRAASGEFVFTREGRGALTPVPEAYWVRPE